MENDFLRVCCYRSLAAVFTGHMTKVKQRDFVYYNEVVKPAPGRAARALDLRRNRI